MKRALFRVQECLSGIFSCGRSVSHPNSPHSILANRRLYSQKYYHFEQVRGSLSFILRDSPLASLVRMYELLLCGFDEQLGLEVEYFWNRKWKVGKIPDPREYGWDRDLGRDRIFQAIAITLLDSFNYRVCTGDETRSMDKIPKWATPLFDKFNEPDELYRHYPGLGKLYFFLPWRHFSFVHPPCYSRIVISHKEYFTSKYKHYTRIMSLPLFVSRDTPLSSLCRLYELRALATCVPEMKAHCRMELNYLLKRKDWQNIWVQQFPDPRLRWEKLDIREPDSFGELVELVKFLVKVEKELRGRPGNLPSWTKTNHKGKT